MRTSVKTRRISAPRGVLMLALLALLATLTACGGGDDGSDPLTCYVDGKAMPSEACR